MNLFEDLVVELKEENLLEEIAVGQPQESESVSTSSFKFEEDDEEYRSETEDTEISLEDPDEEAVLPGSFGLTDVEPELPMEDGPDAADDADIKFQEEDDVVEIRKPNSERAFFRKRASAEISSLQMVDAVLSAVERERMKIVPESYDDFEAKKALNFFLHVPDTDPSETFKEAEVALMKEIEQWCSALAERDKNISVANLRQYSETCRPMLSSQALLSLARFYRNLPYSESVRGKFDCIITRLFSRPLDGEKRKLLFARDEMLGHIKTLYADWSSVPLYAADDAESDLKLTVLSFEDLTREAETATSFDDLIKSDFFGRIRLFKESIAEMFFAPIVTAAAIECNISIGNVYVDLISDERRNASSAIIHQKFGELDDQTVSEAAGRTLELVQMLRGATLPPQGSEADDSANQENTEADSSDAGSDDVNQVSKPGNPYVARIKAQILGFNRALLVFSIFLLLASGGLYVYSNYYAEEKLPAGHVKTLSFQGTEFAEMVKTAKISGDTLYVVAQPTMDTVGSEQLTDFVQKIRGHGKDKGWVNVNLMNSRGQTIAYGTPGRVEITKR